MLDSLRPMKGFGSTTLAVRGLGGRAVSAELSNKPENRPLVSAALAAGASPQASRVSADALRKLRRVSFMMSILQIPVKLL